MAILIAVIGVVAIILGLQGFREAGIPFTKKKRIVGGPAKLIGVFCISFGVLCILSVLALFVWIYIDSQP